MTKAMRRAGRRGRPESKRLYKTKARLIRLVLDERPAGFDRSWLPRRGNPLRWLRWKQSTF